MLQASQLIFFFSRGLGADRLLNFRWPFYSPVLGQIGSKKTLMEKVAERVRKEKKKKEKDILNYKYKVTFQPDGCAEPTCAATCFIHFCFGHRLDNIRFLKCPFVAFHLFVIYCFACELVGNVLVNQKGFLYIVILKILNRNL